MRTWTWLLAVGLLAAPAPAPAEDAPPATGPTLTYLGLNAQGAEEWLREKDGAVVIRVPGGPYQRRPYEGWEASLPGTPFPVASFFVDKHEVTNAQFARFLGDRAEVGEWMRESVPGVVRDPSGTWRAAPGLDRHPVTAATGHGALAYAAWAGARLPTQPEWEKAAGGPDGRLYPWGDAPPDATRANFGRPGLRGLLPVGSFAAGASYYGALDMAGNAYDRVMTRRGEGTLLPVMIKGGSWLSPHPLNLRVLDLCMQPVEVAERSVGFRCAMEDSEPDRPSRTPATAPRLRLAADFDDAVAEARRRRVPIFLSLLYDTCGQCDRTRAQCYQDPRFIAYANEHLVVVIGHAPGDALTDAHEPGEDDACPLYPGLTCDAHLALFREGLAVVDAFRVSPGNFLLHPDRVRKGAGAEALLIPEEAFPKWGDDVDAYLAAFERGRTALNRP